MSDFETFVEKYHSGNFTPMDMVDLVIVSYGEKAAGNEKNVNEINSIAEKYFDDIKLYPFEKEFRKTIIVKKNKEFVKKCMDNFLVKLETVEFDVDKNYDNKTKKSLAKLMARDILYELEGNPLIYFAM